VPEGKSSEAVLCDVVSNAERASVAGRVVKVPVRAACGLGRPYVLCMSSMCGLHCTA
jgi:hypothetical protein